MRRRTLALVLLLALFCPLTAGARAVDLEDPGRAVDLDPDGLRYEPPTLAVWLSSLVRALLAPFGI
jgi:hypothetical protein